MRCVAACDERRIEPLAPDGFDVQLRVRGYFRRGPSAMPWPDTRWIAQSEFIAKGAARPKTGLKRGAGGVFVAPKTSLK